MMNPFPEDWELLWVFEREPEASDGVFVRFDAAIDGNRVVFEAWPMEMEARLTWWRGEEEVGDLALQWIKGVTAETEKNGVSALNFTFEKDCLLPLRFTIRPYPSIAWGISWGQSS